MRIDLRRAQIGMTQQFLDSPNVRATLKQLRRECVPECVATGRLGDFCLPNRTTNGLLNGASVKVVSYQVPVVVLAEPH